MGARFSMPTGLSVCVNDMDRHGFLCMTQVPQVLREMGKIRERSPRFSTFAGEPGRTLTH